MEKIANKFENWGPSNRDNHGFSQEWLLKILLPPCPKKLHKWVWKCVQNSIQIYKIRFWAQGRKDIHKLYQKTAPEGEPRTLFSRPKMHPRGFVGPLGSKTPTHGPKTPPNHDLLLICVPSGLICRRFPGHISKRVRNVPAHWCAFGNAFFNKTLAHWKWSKQVGWRSADILGNSAGLQKAIGLQ